MLAALAAPKPVSKAELLLDPGPAQSPMCSASVTQITPVCEGSGYRKLPLKFLENKTQQILIIGLGFFSYLCG